MKLSGESSVGKADTLLQVKDAETKARLMLEEADEKQRNIIAAARREAVEKVQKAELELRARTESALAQEKKSLAAQREMLLSKGREEASRIESRALERIPKAKLLIRQHFERTLDASTGTNE